MRARTKASRAALWLGAGALAFALGATVPRGQQVAVEHKGGPEQAVRGAQAMVVSDEELAAHVGINPNGSNTRINPLSGVFSRS